MQPQDAERTGRDWLVQLYCPSCGWSGEAMLDQSQMVTRANLQDHVERFTAALAADAVLPEDF